MRIPEPLRVALRLAADCARADIPGAPGRWMQSACAFRLDPNLAA